MGKLVFKGVVKPYEGLTFIFDNDSKSLYSWLHRNIKTWEGEKVKVTIEKIKPKKNK